MDYRIVHTGENLTRFTFHEAWQAFMLAKDSVKEYWAVDLESNDSGRVTLIKAWLEYPASLVSGITSYDQAARTYIYNHNFRKVTKNT